MRFINFDHIVNKNNENYINKNVFVPQHVSNTIINWSKQDVQKLIYYSIF